MAGAGTAQGGGWPCSHNSISYAGLGLPRSRLLMAPEPTNAVISCTTAGVLKGCVTRLVAPVAQRAVVTPDVGAPGRQGSAPTPLEMRRSD